MKFNLNNKQFRGRSNSSGGEVSSTTLFTYYQDGEVIWGNYAGGAILKGTLIGKIIDHDTIEFNYSHINQDMELLSGYCRSTIELMTTGKLRLHEQWEWTTGKLGKGVSIIEEA